MKIAKGIKTVRKVTETKVFDDYGKLVNAVELYVITKLEGGSDGFKLSFRTYSETFGNGGFETTLWVKGTAIENAEIFLTTPLRAKMIASQMGAELISYKTNNKVK